MRTTFPDFVSTKQPWNFDQIPKERSLYEKVGVARLYRFVVLHSAGSALDEGVLTPTVGTSVSQDEQEFQGAMSVWYKHDYKNGEKMLKEFARG